MSNSKEESRNLAADRGKNDDPALRDDSAIQPGVQTVSTGKKDGANEQLTRTHSDNTEGNKNADPRFDDVDKD